MSYLETLPEELLIEICMFLKSDAKALLKLDPFIAKAGVKYLNSIKTGLIDNLDKITLEDTIIDLYEDGREQINRYPGSVSNNSIKLLDMKRSSKYSTTVTDNDVKYVNIKNMKYVYLYKNKMIGTNDLFFYTVYQSKDNEYVYYELSKKPNKSTYKIIHSYKWKDFWIKLDDQIKSTLLMMNSYEDIPDEVYELWKPALIIIDAVSMLIIMSFLYFLDLNNDICLLITLIILLNLSMWAAVLLLRKCFSVKIHL